MTTDHEALVKLLEDVNDAAIYWLNLWAERAGAITQKSFRFSSGKEPTERQVKDTVEQWEKAEQLTKRISAAIAALSAQGGEQTAMKGTDVSENTQTSFVKQLEQIINGCSLENGSNTPDFILAKYLKMCLENFDSTVVARERWYGREAKPVLIEQTADTVSGKLCQSCAEEAARICNEIGGFNDGHTCAEAILEAAAKEGKS